MQNASVDKPVNKSKSKSKDKKRNTSQNKSKSKERSRGKISTKGAVPERQPLMNTLTDQQQPASLKMKTVDDSQNLREIFSKVAEGDIHKEISEVPEESSNELNLSMDQQKELSGYLHEQKVKYIEHVFGKRNQEMKEE